MTPPAKRLVELIARAAARIAFQGGNVANMGRAAQPAVQRGPTAGGDQTVGRGTAMQIGSPHLYERFK